MANILEKRKRLAQKEHKIKTRLLGIKGAKFYILKRQGSTKKFSILATFLYADSDFDRYRHSAILKFAVTQSERFTQGDVSRTMREVSTIATHIALVKPDGESVVYEIRTGDEFEPFYFDSVFQYFVKQIGDAFDPTENAD